MALATYSVVGTTTGSATSHTIGTPSGAAVGDLWILYVRYAGTLQASTGDAATVKTQTVSGSSQVRLHLRVIDGTETGIIINLPSSGAIRYSNFGVSGFYGNLTGGYVVSAGATGSGSVDPDNVDASGSWTGEENLFLCLAGSASAGTFTSYPTNYSAVSNNSTVRIGSYLVTADSNDPGTFTWTSAGNWAAMTLVLRPAAAGGGGSGQTWIGGKGKFW